MTQPSKPGLPSPRPLAIPGYWSPEQAQAVIELLDDLRERIAAHYQIQLIELSREQHASVPVQPDDIDDAPPF
jgi:hypothetical protein